MTNFSSNAHQQKAYWNRWWKLLQPYIERSSFANHWASAKLHKLTELNFHDLGKACDIGCGLLPLSDSYPNKVDLFDVSSYVESKLKSKSIACQSAVFPYLDIPDKSYDVVICFDLLCQLPSSQYRLAISELARITSPTGRLLLSVHLDGKTNDAGSKVLELVNTEYDIDLYEPYYFYLAASSFESIKDRLLNRAASQKYGVLLGKAKQLVEKFSQAYFEISNNSACVNGARVLAEKIKLFDHPSHLLIFASKKPLRKSYSYARKTL